MAIIKIRIRLFDSSGKGTTQNPEIFLTLLPPSQEKT